MEDQGMDAATATAFFGAILVLLMTLPGLALFYGSLISSKNLVDTMLQSVILTCSVSVLWWFIGYSLCFDASALSLFGGTRFMFLNFATASRFNGIPQAVWCGFQLTFAIITPAVAIGAVAERALLWPLIVFANLWVLVVYCPICHMVWGPGGLLLEWGVLDLAGGLVVEVCSGVTALVLCLIVGERTHQTEQANPIRAVLHIIGASLLWVGWLAFNGASAMTNGFQASAALLNTQLCGAAGALAWGATAVLIDKEMPHIQATFNLMGGAVAGLVAATPSSGFVSPSDSVLIGLGAGLICFLADRVLMEYALALWKLDDAVSVFPVHGVGGAWGIFMTGVCARKEVGGASGAWEGNYAQVGVQVASTAVVCLWSAVGTAVCAKAVQRVWPLRASAEVQEKGMDSHFAPLSENSIALHGIRMDSKISDDRTSGIRLDSKASAWTAISSFWSIASSSFDQPARFTRFNSPFETHGDDGGHDAAYFYMGTPR